MTEASPPASSLTRALRWSLVLGANLGGTLLILAVLLPTGPAGVLLVLLALATCLLAYRWELTRDRPFLALWAAVALGAALLSFSTGWHNSLTDEPFVTPALAQLWPDLYGTPLTVSYVQYGHPYTLTDLYNVYLPGLAFAWVPGLAYGWTAIGAWVGSVYLLRRRGEAVVLWGGAWVGLMAANGFNDFVPFLALTLTYVTLSGRAARAAEWVSLGLKQFANVVVVAVHLYHRRWKDAAIAVIVTAAILAPFAYLSPSGVVCHALLFEPNACGASGSAFGAGVVSHLNYLLWPLWAIAVFGAAYVRSLRATHAGGTKGKLGALARRATELLRGERKAPGDGR